MIGMVRNRNFLLGISLVIGLLACGMPAPHKATFPALPSLRIAASRFVASPRLAAAST